MLRIGMSETPTEQRWILQGSLTAPWSSELTRSWKQFERSKKGRSCVVDLNDVTQIDKAGERFLRNLLSRGARLVAHGVYTKHVLEQLKTRESAETPFDRTDGNPSDLYDAVP